MPALLMRKQTEEVGAQAPASSTCIPPQLWGVQATLTLLQGC